MLRKVDFFGWWLEQQLPTARASFSAEKIHLSERGHKDDFDRLHCVPLQNQQL